MPFLHDGRRFSRNRKEEEKSDMKHELNPEGPKFRPGTIVSALISLSDHSPFTPSYRIDMIPRYVTFMGGSHKNMCPRLRLFAGAVQYIR
jgi:hypothetical protein